MRTHSLLRALAFAASVAALAFANPASADPPSRVARLGYMSGAVSFSPAGENDWVRASLNRPLTTGDRLWADPGARAEIQVGGAMIRMNAETSVSILNLDDRITQLQLTQGTLNVRVRRLEPDQVFEVDTPNLAFVVRRPGEYRIEVDPDDDATTIVVRNGQGEAYGDSASYTIDSRQPYRFWGTDLREYDNVAAPRLDDFDRWSSDRDRGYETSVSARYVSPDVVGYQDLDANGTWRVDATYGNVWFPNRVEAGWAPYRDGHWSWIDPWGWTWVDDAPWGFAVSHYGRWTNLRGNWGWVPGPVRTRAYYAPALVAFVGGANFQVSISSGNVGGVAWFPLAPREVYQPSYRVSRGYFENVNRSNTVINNTVINNTYNNINVTNVAYANRNFPGAVVAVPTTAFVQSQPVSRSAVRVSREMMASAPVAVVAPVAPTERSVRGAALQADKRPPGRALERPVVARNAPPAARVGFAAQQQQLMTQPGRPLDEGARRQLKPVADAPAPAIKLAKPTTDAQPMQRPPQAEARGKSDEGKTPAAPTTTRAPEAPTKGSVRAQTAPPSPVTLPPEQRGRTEPRDNAEQRRQPVAPPPAATRPAAPAAAASPPPVAAPAPASQPLEQRGKPDQRSKGEPRAQQTPQVVPQPAAPTPAASPSPAPTTAAAQPPEQRGKSDQRGKPEQRAQPASPPPEAKLPAAPAAAASPRAAPAVAATPTPEQRGRPEQRARVEQTKQPAAQPALPQGAAQPRGAPSKVDGPAPTPQQRAKTEPVPATKQAERNPAAAAPASVPPSSPAPKTESRGQEPKAAAGNVDRRQRESSERTRDEEALKQKP